VKDRKHIQKWLVWAIASLISLVLGWTPAVVWAAELPIQTDSAPSDIDLSIPTKLDSDAIPSDKINQFVQACVRVVSLIERREGELQAAETESESLRIQQEIEAEALAIIQAAGLTRQEYVQLLGLANTDAEFGERVAILLQEAGV